MIKKAIMMGYKKEVVEYAAEKVGNQGLDQIIDYLKG